MLINKSFIFRLNLNLYYFKTYVEEYDLLWEWVTRYNNNTDKNIRFINYDSLLNTIVRNIWWSRYKQYNEKKRRSKMVMENIRLNEDKRRLLLLLEDTDYTGNEHKDYLKIALIITDMMRMIHSKGSLERLMIINDIFDPIINDLIRFNGKKLLMRYAFIEPSSLSNNELGIYAISVLNKEYIHPKFYPIIRESRAICDMQYYRIERLSPSRRRLFEYFWSKHDLFIYKFNTGMKCMIGDVSQINFYFNLNSNLLYFYIPADEKGFALLKQFEENKFWKDKSNHKGKRKPDFIDPILLSCELINIKDELESKTTLHTCYTNQEFKEKYPKDFINNPSTLFLVKDSYGLYENIKVPTTDEILSLCEVCDDPEGLLAYYQNF